MESPGSPIDFLGCSVSESSSGASDLVSDMEYEPFQQLIAGDCHGPCNPYCKEARVCRSWSKVDPNL